MHINKWNFRTHETFVRWFVSYHSVSSIHLPLLPWIAYFTKYSSNGKGGKHFQMLRCRASVIFTPFRIRLQISYYPTKSASGQKSVWNHLKLSLSFRCPFSVGKSFDERIPEKLTASASSIEREFEWFLNRNLFCSKFIWFYPF